MRMKLRRVFYKDNYTIGALSINGVFYCDTLEDKYRNLEIETKVQGETCIPYGTYKVVMTMSGKFKRVMPELLNVPHFTNIRIHSGNKDVDTEGCILVGRNSEVGKVTSSRLFSDALNDKINGAINNGEEVTIEVA